MPLVEVVRTAVVDDDAFAAALDFAQGLGKEAVPCPDTPGFLVNRLLIPLLNDAARMLDETGAAPEDVDRALKAGAGWPMGPLALMDLIGIDVQAHAAEALWQAHREERLAPPARLCGWSRPGIWAARPAAGSSARPATRAGRSPRSSRSLYSRRTAYGTLLPIMGPCDALHPSGLWSWSPCWRCRSWRPPARRAWPASRGTATSTSRRRRAPSLRRGPGRSRPVDGHGHAAARRDVCRRRALRTCATRRKIRGSNTYEWRLFAPARVFILAATTGCSSTTRCRCRSVSPARAPSPWRAGRADRRCRREPQAYDGYTAVDVAPRRGRDVPARRLP